MTQGRTWTRWLFCAPLLLLVAGGAARAAVSYDVAVGMNVSDDSRIFLNLANQTWLPGPSAGAVVLRDLPYPEDDFPVLAFVAYHTRTSPTVILNLRREGYHWADIFFRQNVNPSVLFVGIDRDPGPPYGNAWGYWKKRYRPGAKVRYRFSDRDVIGLVKVQTAARHFGTSPVRIIEEQRRGKRVEAFAANRWREKHGKRAWGEGASRGQSRAPDRGGARAKDSGGSKGQGKGKAKGPSKGHGKGPKG